MCHSCALAAIVVLVAVTSVSALPVNTAHTLVTDDDLRAWRADEAGWGLWGKRNFGAIVEEILGLIEQIGSPALGVCLDTSHANIQGLNQPEAIRACGEKLIALHISDNDGSGDQHRTPGTGSVDFPSIVAALREVGYASNLNLEIPGENGRGTAPSAIIELRSRYALGVCEVLLS